MEEIEAGNERGPCSYGPEAECWVLAQPNFTDELSLTNLLVDSVQKHASIHRLEAEPTHKIRNPLSNDHRESPKGKVEWDLKCLLSY